MHDFEYVPNQEWEPIRDELFEIIHRLQDEVRDEFTSNTTSQEVVNER